MRSRSILVLAAALLWSPSVLADAENDGIGCFSVIPGFTKASTDTAQTSSLCASSCKPLGKQLEAISGGDCYCGDTLPSKSALVAVEQCSTGCFGYGQVKCGRVQAPALWTIFTTGLNTTEIPFSDGSSTTSSTSSSASPTTTSSTAAPLVTTATATIITSVPITPTSVPSTSTAPAATGGSGTNTAGIAAGVVVGLIAIAAIAGGIFLYIRRQRRRAVEEEHKRQVAISAFTAGGKSGGSMNSNDMRLDPVMVQRRMSDGSIADNQDYSRRILKVTNA